MLKVALASHINYSEHHGLLALIAYLDKFGQDVVSEIKVFNLNNRNIIDSIKAFCPDVIGYSMMTGEHQKMLQLNHTLKSLFTFLSVWGGAHPTFFPDFINNDSIDVIVRGEGERAFLQLLCSLRKGCLSEMKILNTWIKLSDGTILKNDINQELEDISTLPSGNRKRLYDAFPLLKKGGLKTFIMSRGCIYNCSYCYNYQIRKMYGPKFFRFTTPQCAVAEMEMIKKLYPLSFIQFSDDIIFPNSEWLREFSDLYHKRINLPFNCNIRPNMITSETAYLLKKAGCFSVNMAIEHGDYLYRKETLSRNITDEIIINAVKEVQNQGIKVACQNMIGLPESGIAGDIKTIALNIKVKPDNTIVHIFQPYPGTQLGDHCVKLGLYDGNPDAVYETTYDETIVENNKYVRNLHYYFPFLVKLRISNPKVLKRILSWPKIPFSTFLFFIFKYFMYKRVVNVKESWLMKFLRIWTILRYGTFGKLGKINKIKTKGCNVP